MEIFRHLRGPLENVANFTPITDPSISHQTRPNEPSFGSTTASTAPTNIFTPAITSLNTTLNSTANPLEEEVRVSSPDLFSTQDMMDITADETFETSFRESCQPTKADRLFDDLCARTPFKHGELGLSHKLSFRNRYELQRVADALHLPPKELLSDLGRNGISSSNDYDTFWAAARIIAKARGHQLPERSPTSAWTSASDSFFESEAGKRSVYLAGALTYRSKVDEGLFEFKLKPLHLETSCRFHRKYGPSRFLVLSLPSLSAGTPDEYKEDARSGVLTNSVARWLATTHDLLGRKWRTFFLEPDKTKSKIVKQAPFYKVHLFAVSGEDLPAESGIEVEQFLNWHIPIKHNLKSTNLKLFQRLSLGLSKTIATFPIEVSEFIHLPDPVDHEVMNDGCARMSMTLAKDISRHAGLNEIPSVFQGRIAGAKGLWMVVPDYDFVAMGKRNYCVEISDSQLKIHPHPKDNEKAEETQRTFEISGCSTHGKPACLNTQLLTILHDRGVLRETLGDLLVADIGTFYDPLELSMKSTVSLRDWIQSSEMYSRSEEGIRMTGSWPDEAEEQAIMMVEHGFTPESSPFLRECLRSILTKHLDRYVERLQIRIPCSTCLYCIADPYGILEPNEVHLSFSEVWRDPVSGFKESFVDGRDILVARPPALLPSDIQRRQAVWKRELHHFKDVIVFSTKGEIPLAHMLSGGDYDGDKPWICWDLDIVKHFQNAPLPKMPSKKDCGLVQHNRRVKDVFFQGTSREQLGSQIGEFLAGCFAFNLNTSYLGHCTLEHEKVVYFDGDLSAPSAIKLATLCGYLVDSAKQGDVLPTATWRKLLKEVSPRRRDDPAYKNEKCVRHKRKCNIIDYLKFWQAVPEKDRILTQFNRNWPQQSSRDATLSHPWTSMRSFGKGKGFATELGQVLDQLEEDVKQVADDWGRQLPKKDEAWATGQFRQAIGNLCDQFRAIKPSKAINEFTRLWEYDQDKRNGPWSLLRASCLYTKFAAGKMAWYVAGEELCWIKAKGAETGSRLVLDKVYSVLKCDSKVAKRVQRRLDDRDFEEDTFGCEGMDKVLMMEQYE